MRRLPPNKIEQNLNGLLNLIPEETDELLQRVDQPLKEGTDPETVSLTLASFPISRFLIVFKTHPLQQGRKYLLCDYNRDGDSYRYFNTALLLPALVYFSLLRRSPWSNTYEPAIEDGFLPSEKLRNMEIEFNELFDAYREMYFEGGTSSVYLWDQDQGFAGCFLIKKSTSLPI